MFSKLLPKEYGFFELFIRHAKTTQEGANLLVQLTSEWPQESEVRARRIKELEHDCDSITHMTIDLIHRTFITPLDRDEILKLISKLDEVMDCIETASDRMIRFKVPEMPRRLVEMTQVLVKAQQQVVVAVEKMRGFKEVKQLRALIQDIHRLENDGDELVHAGVAALFTDYASDPLMVIKLKEIYEIVERGIDECEDVANIVEGIVLEHS